MVDSNFLSGVVIENGSAKVLAMCPLSPSSVGKASTDRRLVMIDRDHVARVQLIRVDDLTALRSISGLFGTGRTATGAGQLTGMAEGGLTRRRSRRSRLETGLALFTKRSRVKVDVKWSIQTLNVVHTDVSQTEMVQQKVFLGSR